MGDLVGGSDLTQSVVWSCNEWDPLEECIVGVVEGATVPEWDVALRATSPKHAEWFFRKYGGQPFPQEMVSSAARELDGLSELLVRLGVKVTRPQRVDFSKTVSTPWWSSTGLYAAMPRDVLLVVGDMLIEAPMAWRSRYFEAYAYRHLLQDYFSRGAKWIAAPKPTMAGDFYRPDYSPDVPRIGDQKQFVISENEIAFDAADFVRCGRDIFAQRSNVTNALGIEWMRRHVGSDFRVHEVEFDDDHPMHIDTTIVPLAPGKLLVNPVWVNNIPEQFKSWEVRRPPPPVNPYDSALYFSSDWLTINFLSLDEKTAIVEEREEPLIQFLKDWGFDTIAIPFRNFYPFGGSIHCATADIRRSGGLRSYF